MPSCQLVLYMLLLVAVIWNLVQSHQMTMSNSRGSGNGGKVGNIGNIRGRVKAGSVSLASGPMCAMPHPPQRPLPSGVKVPRLPGDFLLSLAANWDSQCSYGVFPASHAKVLS